MRIEPLLPSDAAAADVLFDEAFGADRRARTAYRLRAGAEPIAELSLCIRNPHAPGKLVGALQCWPIALEDAWGKRSALTLLGPVAVAATHRGEGIGARLIRACMDRTGARAMLLIGDASYYGRFGFSAADTERWQLPGPVEPGRLLARETRGLPSAGRILPCPTKCLVDATS